MSNMMYMFFTLMYRLLCRSDLYTVDCMQDYCGKSLIILLTMAWCIFYVSVVYILYVVLLYTEMRLK